MFLPLSVMLMITSRRSFLPRQRVINCLANNLSEIAVIDTLESISEAIDVAVWSPASSISRTSTMRAFNPCLIILIGVI